MESVLYDIQLAQSIYDNRRRDFDSEEKRKALFDAVLNKHHITQAVLDSSLVYYADNMSVMLRMNDSVSARLRRDKEVFDKRRDQEISFNERYDQRKLSASHYFLTPSEPTYKFNLDSIDRNNISISSLEKITFEVLGKSPETNLSSAVNLQYTDTSFVLPFSLDEDSLTYRVDIPTLYADTTERKLNAVSGYIHVSSAYPDYNVLIHNIRFASKDSTQVSSVDENNTSEGSGSIGFRQR